MKRLLGGVMVGLLVAGVIAGAAVPLVPALQRQRWILWIIAAVAVAVSAYVARRTAKTPPRR